MDYGEYYWKNRFQFLYLVTVGNKLYSGLARFTTKPTKKQLRVLKQSWIRCVMREWDGLTNICLIDVKFKLCDNKGKIWTI